MKKLQFLMVVTQLTGVSFLAAQQVEMMPDLSKVSSEWTVFNRTVTYDDAVHLDAQPGDGFVRLNGSNFTNGDIEFDVKGKDVPGGSFVGLAFHGLNDSTFDAIYFRPFNFKNAGRSDHSVQYISHPVYTWNKLREDHPGKYESKATPVPDPSEWFHVKVMIRYPVVKVFVNNANESSLTVNQLSDRKKGWVGFWVGNESDGNFKQLKIVIRKPE